MEENMYELVEFHYEWKGDEVIYIYKYKKKSESNLTYVPATITITSSYYPCYSCMQSTVWITSAPAYSMTTGGYTLSTSLTR